MKQSRDLQIANQLIQLNSIANNQRVPFDLSIEDITKLFDQKVCHFTGKQFTEGGDFIKVYERIDKDKGFIQNNVVVTTQAFSRKKGHLSIEEIEMLWLSIQNYKRNLSIPTQETKDQIVDDWVLIQGYPNYIINSKGDVKNTKNQRLLSPNKYGIITLSLNSTPTHFKVSNLLEEYFDIKSNKNNNDNIFISKTKTVIAAKFNRYVIINEHTDTFDVHKIKGGIVDITKIISLNKKSTKFIGERIVKYKALSIVK